MTCTVTWDTVFAGSTAAVLVDRTAPVVSAAVPGRPPDHDGWYNHPVAFTFQGSDSPSGIAACDTVLYSPPAASDRVTGGCTDLAGNRATASFPAAYDSSPPAPARVTVVPGNRSISFRWKAPADAAGVQVARSAPGNARAPEVIYNGTGTHVTDRRLKNGVRYHYVVTVFDRAGNAMPRRLSAVPTASRLRPVNGSRVAAPPRLTWAPARGASYYNVQLMRMGVKILSAWPHGTHLQLRAAWMFRGKKQRLTAGPYRWYVWPGYGPRSERRYGGLLGSSVFRVTP